MVSLVCLLLSQSSSSYRRCHREGWAGMLRGGLDTEDSPCRRSSGASRECSGQGWSICRKRIKKWAFKTENTGHLLLQKTYFSTDNSSAKYPPLLAGVVTAARDAENLLVAWAPLTQGEVHVLVAAGALLTKGEVWALVLLILAVTTLSPPGPGILSRSADIVLPLASGIIVIHVFVVLHFLESGVNIWPKMQWNILPSDDQ